MDENKEKRVLRVKLDDKTELLPIGSSSCFYLNNFWAKMVRYTRQLRQI